jgi:hypothetical protein
MIFENGKVIILGEEIGEMGDLVFGGGGGFWITRLFIHQKSLCERQHSIYHINLDLAKCRLFQLFNTYILIKPKNCFL